MKNLSNQITRNMLSQALTFVISLLINFFLVPLIVEKIGKEVYGFYTLANNFLEYAGIITIVINGMANRYITVHYVRGELAEANGYFTSVTIMNILFTLIMSVPAVLAVCFLDYFINVPSAHALDIKALWLFTFLMFFTNLIFSRYDVAAFAKNRLDVTATINMGGMILKAVGIIAIYAVFAPRISYIGMIVFVCAIFTSVAKVFAKNKLAPDLCCKKSMFDLKKVKTLARDGIWNSVSQLSQILFTGLDLLIANILLGANEMSLLSIAKTIPIMIIGFIGVIAGAFYPTITISYSTQSKTELVEKVCMSSKICGFICSIPILAVIVFGKSFFALWLPTLSAADIKEVHILSVLTLLPQLLSVYVFPLHQINTITCRVKTPASLDCLLGVVNVLLVILLIKLTNFGIYAVAGVSSVLLFLKTILFVPIYAAAGIKVQRNTFYPYILRGVVLTFLVLALFILINSVVFINGWIELLLVAAASAVAGYFIGFYVIFSKRERIEFISKVREKLGK